MATAFAPRALANPTQPAPLGERSAGLVHPGPLTPAERIALARGDVVRRDVEAEVDGGRYIGGVAYVLVRAPPGALISVLGDVTTYTEIFPMCVEARLVLESTTQRGAAAIVALRHQARYGAAEYAMRVVRERFRMRFWLERSLPHDLEDAWGYFRVDRAGIDQSLLTYAALMDIGLVLRLLFEKRVRDVALGTPRLVKTYVERRWAAAIARRRSRSDER